VGLGLVPRASLGSLERAYPVRTAASGINRLSHTRPGHALNRQAQGQEIHSHKAADRATMETKPYPD